MGDQNAAFYLGLTEVGLVFPSPGKNFDRIRPRQWDGGTLGLLGNDRVVLGKGKLLKWLRFLVTPGCWFSVPSGILARNSVNGVFRVF